MTRNDRMRFLSALFPSLNEEIEDQSLDYVVFNS